ncbi:TonB-dependent receptor [Luteimonas sp. A277]
MKFRTHVVRLGVLPSAIAAALLPAVLAAQETPPADPTTLDRIEVTGSRIRGVEIENQQPIVTVTREEIERTGHVSVADLLQNIASAGSPAISRADALASGENVGGYYVDIRNLGATRTLVLVNGVRLGSTTGGLQDLSQIPMAAIDRIDILKDGASSIYGSDAIAAVVNIITRKRFEGAEASVQYGQYTDGDGGETIYSGVFGASNDRGGVTIAAEVMESDPVLAGSRWFSRYGNAGPDFPGSGWSPVSQNGSFCNPCSVPGLSPGDPGYVTPVWNTLRPGGNPANAADYVPITPDQYANSNLQMLLQTGLERKSVFTNINYDLTDRITFNGDITYNQRTTNQQIAGYPYQAGAFGTPLSADSVFNVLGRDIDFRRRLWEVPRTTRSELDTMRFVGSLEGYFDVNDRPWDWTVSYAYNKNDLTKTARGDASLLATAPALGPSFFDDAGVARCGAPGAVIDGCVPWNPLLPYGVPGQGSLANANLQEFLFPLYTDSGETKTKIFSANLTGGLFALPGGDLAFAVGVERREESGEFVPDAFAQSGNHTGLAAQTTRGEYEVDEAYLEFNIPLLRDVPFAQELTVNLASRHSDYSNFGTTTNSKASFLWRPLDELAVRATWAEGFRAPSIDNLFGGSGSSFEFYTDPCSVGVAGSVAGSASCINAGVPVNYVQLGQGLQPCTSWPCQTPDQFTTGSNPRLGPEESKSWTAGVVWSPGFADGLDLSLDWYSYKISNAIFDDSVNRILRDCYVLGDASRCALVTRDPDDGHISHVFFGLTNLGQIETEGWDFGLKYRTPETAFGGFNFDWQTAYLSSYDVLGQNAAGDDILIGGAGETGFFRVRSVLSTNWRVSDEWNATWTARFYSAYHDGCVTARPCSDPDRYAYGESAPRNRLGSNTFHDVQVAYQAPWNATIALGVDNVLDREASIMFSGNNVSTAFPYYPEFDIGRFAYMRYTQRF